MSNFPAGVESGMSSSNICLGSMVTKMLWRQQRDLINKHPDGVKIIINDEDPLDISAIIEGPKDTPYEGGFFKVKIVVGPEFPQVAPKGFFVTKIYHPNVSEKGEICVNTLKKDWNSKQWSLYQILEVICINIILIEFKYIFIYFLLGNKMPFNYSFSRKFVK